RHGRISLWSRPHRAAQLFPYTTLFRSAHHVVHDRRAGEDRGWGEYRALAHDRALVHAAPAAHRHVVLDDHGDRAHRLEHASDLGGCREVHSLADLGARADEGMAVDHRTLVHVGADVYVHRRHVHEALGDI